MPRLLLAPAIGLLTLWPLGSCGIREAELRCEEAAAHMYACCPTFKKELLDCSDVPAPSGGTSPRHAPDIALEAARCINALDCATLLQTDYCVRVEKNVTMRQTVTCP